MTKNKPTAQSWSTPAHSQTHLSDWLLRRTYYHCQGGGLTVASARDPGAMCHFGLPAACGHSQGGGTSSIGSRMQQVCSWLETIGLHCDPLRVLRPAGRDVEQHANLYTCGFLSKTSKETLKNTHKLTKTCRLQIVWVLTETNWQNTS